MSGQSGSVRAKRGRPKKKPGYNRNRQIQDLIDKAVSLFAVPYDDRDEREDGLPTVEAVALEMNISTVKVRKLLITAEYFTTESSREVQRLHNGGCSIREISQRTGLKQSSIYGYIPYSRGAYKLKDPTVQAEQNRLFRRRKKVCDDLRDHLGKEDVHVFLWDAILAFENYPFRISETERISYKICDGCICYNGEKITKQDVERRFDAIQDLKQSDHFLEKSVKCAGSYELYVIFLRVGACRK